MHRPEHSIVEGDESPNLPDPKPAATLVLFDERHTAGEQESQVQRAGPPQLLMVNRAESMQFAGGATVWPGGRVDPDDRIIAAQLAPSLDPEDAAGRVAAIRETLEETGLLVGADASSTDASLSGALRADLHAQLPFSALLARHGITLDLTALVPFARWIPKMNSHRRFDTRFYIARRPAGDIPLSIDPSENSALFWATAADVLAMADAGTIMIIFPTRRNLERLAQYADFKAAVACARSRPPQVISPWIEHRSDGKHLVIPHDEGYPVTAERLEQVMRG